MKILLLLVAALLACQAKATDEIVCTSRQFQVALVVGSDGYVPNMILRNTSEMFFTETLQISNLKKRYLSIRNRSANIEALLDVEKAKNIEILIKHGKGFIKLDSLKEEVFCDWRV